MSWMTVREAALILGVSTREIHRRLATDRLRSRLEGRTFQVDVDLPGERSRSSVLLEARRHRQAPAMPQPPPSPQQPPPAPVFAFPQPVSSPHAENQHPHGWMGWMLLSTLILTLIAVGVAQWFVRVLDRWQEMPMVR